MVQRHVPGFLADGHTDIVAVSNSTTESATRFCKSHAPSAEVVGDWRDVVGRNDIDIVWIGTTPHMHAEVSMAALEAGKHVFCQARMACNLDEALRMREAAKARPSQVVMLCPPPTGLAGNAFVLKLLAEEALGEIRHIHLRSLNGAFIDPDKPAHWRQRREISGLNILALGIHVEVLQRWLGRIEAVSAAGKVFIRDRQGYAVDIPDILDVCGQWENGALGTLQFSGIHSGLPVECLEIEGEKGVLCYDYKNEQLSLQRGDRVEQLEIPSEMKGGWQVESDFLKAVRDPSAPRPHPDFDDGVAYMAVVQAVDESLRSGGFVDVRLIR